jgi:hypothetical protein
MRGKRTRNYGVPVACATTAQSLPPQDNADFAASQRSHFVMKFVGRERGDRSILIARELIRERAGFKTKVDDFIRIVDAVCAEVRDRTGQQILGFLRGRGFVSNLTHPGGNITGFTSFEPSIASKWLDFLKQAVPGLSRVAVIFNPDTSPQSKLFVPVVESSAPSFAIEVMVVPVHAIADFEPAIADFSRHPNSGLILLPDQFTTAHRGLILELVTRYHLPAIYAGSESFARDGGLIYYGFDQEVQFRQAAIYADRILKGANPGDLPIQQPTKFPLIINLTAARTLGIEMPTGLLLRADEVIE